MTNEDPKDIKDSEEKFSFIKEQIVQKPRHRAKRIALILFGTVALAIIFGVVAKLAYYAADPLAVNIFGKEKSSQKFIIPSVLPGYTASSSTDSTTEDSTKPSETTQPQVIKETVIVDNTTPADLSDFKNMYDMIAQVADKINSSIVTVTSVTSGYDWFLNPYENKNTTSGILISNDDKELLVLTYKSKLVDVNNIRITFIDNTTVSATLKSYSKDTDIAIVSVDLLTIPKETLKEIKIAVLGSSQILKIGTPIIAVGNPNGYSYSIESGYINTINNYVQTSDNNISIFNTSISDNPNGSGFIINLEGQVVGIISSKFKTELNASINTNIGITDVRLLINKLLTNENRAYFGIIGLDVTKEISIQQDIPEGIYISKVLSGSPAIEAGLQNGDIVIGFDGKPIINMDDLEFKLANSSPEDVKEIVVMRTTQTPIKEMRFTITLGSKLD